MKEKQKQEALIRMKLLGLSEGCIKAFQDGQVWLSEEMGALYELNDKEQDIVNTFEREHDAVVYHMIHDVFEFGEVYSILFVSKYTEEWKSDKEDFKEGYAFVYAQNITYPYCSDFGSIGIRSAFGGLIRIG